MSRSDWYYLCGYTQTLRSALSEENGVAWLQVLRPLHKLELNMAFVSRPGQVSIHIQDFGCLSNDSAVNNSLVICLYCCGVMQDDYLCLEVKDTLRVRVLVSQDHSLSESRALQLQFLRVNWLDVETDTLARDRTVHWLALVMNGLYHYLVKLSRLVWSE